MVMDDFTWRLVMRWLDAQDVGSASRVCKSWNKMLSSSQDCGDLWKQICANTYSESTVQSFLSVQPNWDFRRLAESLYREVPMEELPRVPLTHNLPLNSIFAVVELCRIERSIDVNKNKRRRHVIASWSQDQIRCESQNMLRAHDTVGVLTVENPYASSTASVRKSWYCDDDEALGLKGITGITTDIVEDAVRAHIGKRVPRLRVTLFRRDNMKSVCIVDSEAFIQERGPLLYPDIYEKRFCWMNEDIKVDCTQAGGRALILQAEHESNAFECTAGFDLRILEEKEFPWLSELRDCRGGKQIRSLLSKIPAFKVQICDFSLSFHCTNSEGDRFFLESENDMAVALEGLRWR